MKNVIPFSKELDFSTKLSEITSISLEREFEVHDTTIEGNLFVTGDYKSHDVSVNLLPFSFKIPFSIEIPDNIVEDTITLEISDFAYDILEDSKIKVNIELELSGDEKSSEEESESEMLSETPEVNTEEILEMMEEERNEEEEQEEIQSMEVETEEEKVLESVDTDVTHEDEDVVLESVSNEDEYATYHIHLVKDGETVETICTMYNSNVNLLADYNDLTNLTPGEKLIIPNNDES